MSRPQELQPTHEPTDRAGTSSFHADGPEVQRLRQRITSPWQLRLFMLAKLPLALVAGLRVRRLDAECCEVTVPYGWRTTNPFRSTYFAALSMAAEMSTGALGLVVVQAAPAPVSILIVGMKAEFVKKATGLTTFRCEAGRDLAAAVTKALETGDPVVCTAQSVGTDEAGVEVARFEFTWSFKRKSK